MQAAQRCNALAIAPKCWQLRIDVRTGHRESIRPLGITIHHATRRHYAIPAPRDDEGTHHSGTKDRYQEEPNNVNSEDVINPLSLSETLEAHRRLNEETPIIRRLRSETPVHIKQPIVDREGEAHHVNFRRRRTERSREEWNDYGGKVRHLSFDWQVIGDIPRYQQFPWVRDLDQSGPSREFAQDRLSTEIRAVDAFFTSTAHEVHIANKAQMEIRNDILRCIGKSACASKVDLIGSRASGFATPLSDIDLNLMVKDSPEATEHKVASSTLMGRIFKNLKYYRRPEDKVETTYFASQARVPIVVGVHTETGLEFQLQSATSGYGSLEVTNGLAAEYLSLRALFKVLKQMLKMRDLTEGGRGITSYPLLNMIVVSMKMDITIGASPHNLGHNLLRFLDFWTDMDLYNTGITHLPSRYVSPIKYADDWQSYFKDDETALQTIAAITQDPVSARPVIFNPSKSLAPIHQCRNDYKMVLHDPANPYNDLGRSATLIKHIQTTLVDIRAELKKDMSDWDRTIRADAQTSKRPRPLLASVIGGDYSLYNLERKRTYADIPSG